MNTKSTFTRIAALLLILVMTTVALISCAGSAVILKASDFSTATFYKPISQTISEAQLGKVVELINNAKFIENINKSDAIDGTYALLLVSSGGVTRISYEGENRFQISGQYITKPYRIESAELIAYFDEILPNSDNGTATVGLSAQYYTSGKLMVKENASLTEEEIAEIVKYQNEATFTKFAMVEGSVENGVMLYHEENDSKTSTMIINSGYGDFYISGANITNPYYFHSDGLAAYLEQLGEKYTSQVSQ